MDYDFAAFECHECYEEQHNGEHRFPVHIQQITDDNQIPFLINGVSARYQPVEAEDEGKMSQKLKLLNGMSDLIM